MFMKERCDSNGPLTGLLITGEFEGGPNSKGALTVLSLDGLALNGRDVGVGLGFALGFGDDSSKVKSLSRIVRTGAFSNIGDVGGNEEGGLSDGVENGAE